MPHSRPRLSFTLRAALRETLDNLGAHPGSLVARILLAATVGFGVVYGTLWQVAGIEARYAGGIDAGRFVWRVAGTSPDAQLPSGRCDSLGAIRGVRAAGAALSGSQVIAGNQPEARYELLRVTAGLPPIYWPEDDISTPTGGVLAGSAVARTLGLVPGAAVRLADETMPSVHVTLIVDRVMPPSPREESADRRLFVVVPAGPGTLECLVDPDPASSAAVGDIVRAWFPADLGVTVLPFLPGTVLSRTPEAELADRLSAWGWPLGTAVLTSTTLLIWYARRADAALYRLLGLTTPKLALMYGVEHVLTTLAPTQTGVLVAVLLAGGQGILTPLAGQLASYENLALVSALAVLPIAYALWQRLRTRTLDTIKGY